MCVAALSPYVDRDWRAQRAADLDWSCWDTAMHISDSLYFYAVQVLHGPKDRVPLTIALTVDDDTRTRRLLSSITTHGELLRRTLLAAGPDARGYHFYGVSDPEGFTAMGVLEVLVHTFDVVGGLDSASTWRPPAALAAPVIERLFPSAPEGDPSDVLLYCCGRRSLNELPRQEAWRWDSTIRPGG